MAGVFEELGKRADRADAMDAAYRDLLMLVQRIKDGQVNAADVEINHDRQSWAVHQAQSPALITESDDRRFPPLPPENAPCLTPALLQRWNRQTNGAPVED